MGTEASCARRDCIADGCDVHPVGSAAGASSPTAYRDFAPVQDMAGMAGNNRHCQRRRGNMLKSTLIIGTALAALACPSLVVAQQNLPVATNQTQNIKRIPLQRFDVPGASYETVIGIAEIAPNVSVGRHNHPGPESGYLIEGSLEPLIDGQSPRLVKTGE